LSQNLDRLNNYIKKTAGKFSVSGYPADFMKPATASADNGAFSVQKTIFRPEGISIRFRPADT
jgi:hypothetical protein